MTNYMVNYMAINVKILSVKSVQSVVSKNKKRKTILSKKVYFIRLFLEN